MKYYINKRHPENNGDIIFPFKIVGYEGTLSMTYSLALKQLLPHRVLFGVPSANKEECTRSEFVAYFLRMMRDWFSVSCKNMSLDFSLPLWYNRGMVSYSYFIGPPVAELSIFMHEINLVYVIGGDFDDFYSITNKMNIYRLTSIMTKKTVLRSWVLVSRQEAVSFLIKNQRILIWLNITSGKT